MTTYSTLIGAKTADGSIQQWVNDGSIPSASIVSKAEGMIYQNLRVREMKALATGTIAAGASTLDLSSLDMLEPIAMQITGDSGGMVSILDNEHYESRIYINSSDSLEEGIPSEATVIDATMHFNFKADAAYKYRLVYFKTPAALAVTTNETNFLTDRYPHLLEAACYYWAYSFKKDRQEADHWLQVALGAIDKANEEYGMYQGQIRYENFWSTE